MGLNIYTGALRRFWSCYARSLRASIMTIFAIAGPIVIASAGMALDMSHAYLVRERLSHALDAAALASAGLAGKSEAEAFVRLQTFMNANYPSDKVGTTYQLDLDVQGDDIIVSAYADYNTFFLKMIGVSEITVYAETIVRREVRGLEVALVLDVTGSMRGSAITSLRTATKDFIEIIFDRVSDPSYLKVGLVPYAIAVNVGEEGVPFVDPPVHNGVSVPYDPDDGRSWAGCVMAREYPDDTDDTSDIDYGDLWQAYWYPHTDDASGNSAYDNLWDTAQGGSLNLLYPQTSDNMACDARRSPNLGCPIHNPITPLTSDEESLDEAADKITHWCRGGTNGNLGMVWGWRVLSPTEPFTQGAAYTDTNWRKAVVMMTDGENTFFQNDYTAYGFIRDGNIETTEGADPAAYDYDPIPGIPVTDNVHFVNETFTGNTGSFNYSDGVFGSTGSSNNYAVESYNGATGSPSAGSVAIKLGGIDNTSITNMTGAWQVPFTLGSSTNNIRLKFSYRAYHSGSNAMDSGDNLTLTRRITGGAVNSSNTFVTANAPATSYNTGWVTVTQNIGTLAAGNYVLSLGGRLAAKNNTNEHVTVLYDSIEIYSETSESDAKAAATQEINNRFIKICEKMKDLGITVYTVTFGSGIIGKPTEQFYQDCASDEDKYYPAATNEELIDAFQDISRELSNLHIKG